MTPAVQPAAPSLSASLSLAHLREEIIEHEKERDRPDPAVLSEPIYVFDLDYADERGKHWKGAFTNKILTIRERRQVAVLQARLGGGQPPSSLDPDAAELNRALAHMTFSLSDVPAWAKDLEGLYDMTIVFALWTEVLKHEARFFRGKPLEAPTPAGDRAG